jgi:hypothetical protein
MGLRSGLTATPSPEIWVPVLSSPENSAIRRSDFASGAERSVLGLFTGKPVETVFRTRFVQITRRNSARKVLNFGHLVVSCASQFFIINCPLW